ncbi:MAG TPA: cysteine synthase family protein [Planctomycetota bacterium]|nr:cysteine synthase family protein [Planctomycetota bacterium]
MAVPSTSQVSSRAVVVAARHVSTGFERFSPNNPVRALLPMIGRTPLIELRLRWRGRFRRIFAKAESFNFTGSIKDRMAAWVLADGWERGAWRPGHTIVEASSGNTAIALAALGRALGSPVRIFMPTWMSAERVQILAGFGAELVGVSEAEGGFLGSVARAAHYGLERSDAFLPDQFANQANLEAHACTTGPEILAQLASIGSEPEIFVAGVGTGGTVMGVGRALRESCPRVRIHPLEPAESPILTTGIHCGHHRIQGISDEFIPQIVDLEELDRPVAVHDGDAILAAQQLARCMGLGVGISSGANLLGALQLQNEAGGDAICVTVFPDSNKKYLSTDLFRRQEPGSDWLTPELEFEGWRAVTAVI